MILTFIVSEDVLFYGATQSISFEVFKILTGCKLDLNKRIGKQLTVLRDKGHLYFYDSEFILGEKYVWNNKVYECTYITKDKEALLAKDMDVITGLKPSQFRIA